MERNDPSDANGKFQITIPHRRKKYFYTISCPSGQVETGKLLEARSKSISYHTHLAAFSLVHQSLVVLMIHPVSRQWWGDLSTSVKEMLR